MLLLPSLLPICVVALRKESVDRNRRYYATIKSICVALRKESVDRNKKLMTKLLSDTVALRKESVDRNSQNYSYKITEQVRRSPQGEHGMFLFLTVQGGFVHADIRFNFKNCYSKKLSHKII